MNKNILNTHIIGKAGSGKTFFASNQAASFLKEGKKVLYIDYYRTETFSEVPNLVINPEVTFGGDFDNFKYEDFDKILKDFFAKNVSAKISILEGEFGDERTTRMCYFLSDFILKNKDIFSDYFIFIDEASRFDHVKIEQLLSESKDSNISYTLIHQYLDQFSKEMTDELLKTCKNIIFKLSPSDISYIATMYDLNPDVLSALENYEYKEIGPLNK